MILFVMWVLIMLTPAYLTVWREEAKNPSPEGEATLSRTITLTAAVAIFYALPAFWLYSWTP